MRLEPFVGALGLGWVMMDNGATRLVLMLLVAIQAQGLRVQGLNAWKTDVGAQVHNAKIQDA